MLLPTVKIKKIQSTKSVSSQSLEDLQLLNIPGYNSVNTAGDCWFDEEEAYRAIDFIETYIVHVKGEKAGEAFILEKWERAIIANIFGWKRPDGTRRYREVFLL